MNTPPVTTTLLSREGYEIIDIRDQDKEHVNIVKEGDDQDMHLVQDVANKPPTPPATEEHMDAFNHTTLAQTIINTLDQPAHAKSIPTFVLYDKRGLQLFDEITHQPDYYLTNAEMNILQNHADELVAHLQDNSVIIELGAGALRKTILILKAVERLQKKVTYYALDLDQHELERSLGSLGHFKYVQLKGLLGTYDQGIPWIRQQFSASTHKIILWLGSSIGNQSRLESIHFLNRLRQECMGPGDKLVLGTDKRNSPERIRAAYDDKAGVTRQFIMNGLNHVNTILGKAVFDLSKFTYDTRYQEAMGRHVAHYRATEPMILECRGRSIPVRQGELIHIEYSYKYSDQEVAHMLLSSGLRKVTDWVDHQNLYRLVVAECNPFRFDSGYPSMSPTTIAALEKEQTHCSVCDGEIQDAIKHGTITTPMVPTLYEWQQLWKAWDVATSEILHLDTMLFERPIAMRHPFIFYLGHIPVFLDMLLSRHKVDNDYHAGSPFTEPSNFVELFERGIDPDLDDPTICNPHSIVPETEAGWPKLDTILDYKDRVRRRLARLFEQTNDGQALSKRSGRVLWMAFEHEVMHLETLLYMLVQSPNIRPPRGITPTLFAQSSPSPCLDMASCITVPGGTVTLGHDDDEDADVDQPPVLAPFGWDNENPTRQVSVATFAIQSRPVTNGEFLAYLQATDTVRSNMPSSWKWITNSDGTTEIAVLTVFGPCPISKCMDWPVQVSFRLAQGYADHHHMRIPTEPELMRFKAFLDAPENAAMPKKQPNIGFAAWHPTNVSNDQVHVLGDVWEWTDTIWDTYPGFKPSKLYPGYSADFFDGKHHVLLGGSWATHPRVAERRSFRNWYQAGYPYVFGGFRCCQRVVQ